MKFYSITYLINRSRGSFMRFPLTILSALAGVCVYVYLTEFGENIKNQSPYINFTLTAALGIPLYFCSSIFIIKNYLSFKVGTIITIGVTILLMMVYLSLPSTYTTHNTYMPYIRYTILNIVAHLLVAFIPYIKDKGLNGFWNYNKALFLRFWVSVLYSGFIYVGLTLALLVITTLFNIDIQEKVYLEIFIVVIGLFNTWFFVSGVPKNLDELENIKNYPYGLKVFTQYILLPLLFLYIFILYIYCAKIAWQQIWPKGIISYLISCVSVLGILANLLIYPYGNLEGSTWIKKFTKLYYYILLPLTAMLFIAIWLRIEAYGVTVNRYIIVLLGIWLTIVSLYFIIRKSNIKFIPVSLVLILLPMLFGPWSMFAVSEHSQVKRLREILEKHAMLTATGRIKNEIAWDTDRLPDFYSESKNTNERFLSDSTRSEVESILNYLDDNHGLSKVRPFFLQNIDSLISIATESNKNVNEANVYMETLGLIYDYSPKNLDFISYTPENDGVSIIGDYEHLIFIDMEFFNYESERVLKTFKIDGQKCKLIYSGKKTANLMLTTESDTTVFKVDSLFNKLKSEFGKRKISNISKNKMTLKESAVIFDTKLEISSIKTRSYDDTGIYFQGYLFLKTRNKKQ